MPFNHLILCHPLLLPPSIFPSIRVFSNESVLHISCSVQSLSCVQLFVTPLTAAHQASLSITNSQSSLKLPSIESVMPSNHLILCSPLLLLPPIPPSIRVFSSESPLHIRWFSNFASAEFSKFAGIFSAALSQHHLSGFERAQLEFHHLH